MREDKTLFAMVFITLNVLLPLTVGVIVAHGIHLIAGIIIGVLTAWLVWDAFTRKGEPWV